MNTWWNNKTRYIYYKMGFYSDQKGILRRYLRERDLWQNHIMHTKKNILSFCENKNKNKVAILGSGWLLDVPIDALSEMFSEVWLVDIRHPRKIKQSLQNRNIFFVETDISGFAEPSYYLVQNEKFISPEHINQLNPVLKFDLNQFDCIISCNIMDQLDDLILEYFKKKTIIPAEIEIQLRSLIQSFHLQSLPKGKSLLITDLKEIITDIHHNIVKEKKLLHCSLYNFKEISSWIWDFDNSLLYNREGITRFLVGVFEN